jgi:hypothetical protein
MAVGRHIPQYVFGPRHADSALPVYRCKHMRPVQFWKSSHGDRWIHVDNITRCIDTNEMKEEYK